MFEAYGNMATLYTDAGEYEKARGVLFRAFEINPKSAEVLNNIAYNYQLEGKIDLALKYFRRAYGYYQHAQISKNIDTLERLIEEEKINKSDVQVTGSMQTDRKMPTKITLNKIEHDDNNSNNNDNDDDKNSYNSKRPSFASTGRRIYKP